MSKRFGRVTLAAVGLVLLSTPGMAQLAGQPVYAIPKGTGVSLNLDAGTILSNGVDAFDFMTLAGRATLGLPMVSFTAAFEPEVLDAFENQLMAGAAVTVAPLPTAAVRLQANVGYGLDSKTLVATPGVALTLSPPSPVLRVEPWIFPQFRVVVPDVGDTEADFGISGGVNVGLPGGVGGHVALDYDNFSESITAGIGLHYRITVPGLGMAGM